MDRVREPVVAGAFYTADPVRLRKQIEELIGSSGLEPDPDIVGVVSPHAGYVYSGATAGCAFAAAPSDPGTVVILAPSHRVPLSGASVYAGSGYRTPLGVCETDAAFVERLMAAGVPFEPVAHAHEHSAEVQVPFVQVRWPEARIVVVIQGPAGRGFHSVLARALEEASGGKRFFVVASSDLSHYHPIGQAESLDGRVIDAFLSGDAGRLESVLATGEGEACGSGPMTTLLSWAAMKGYTGFRRLAYDTSATASGDRSAVVGYFAGAVSMGSRE
jgi:AmmeMemoRadiSam system protein B